MSITQVSSPIKSVLPVLTVSEGEGFLVNRAFPRRGLMALDPFLLFDELPPNHLKPGEAKGTPPHPHKGFEILTYILQGEVNHEDSLGNKATLRAGDVQWMTAGKGIVHKEQPSESLKKNGGVWHGFQIWINLPAAKKNITPGYQEIRSEEIPVHRGEGFSVKVLVGTAFGTVSPIHPNTPVEYHHYTLFAGSTVTIPLHATHKAFIYLLKGSVSIGKEHYERGVMPVFNPEAKTVMISNTSTAPTEFIFLSGQPLDEPIARYGPFVMNTEAELEAAFYEYQRGEMGQLSE
ncbi:MAG: pirin family protein [Chloroherpetonaceae bacterium]|nr:pirin family protein [Chloroherpetonaceae bacterium]